MVDINKVFLGGNITKDPELRFTPSGIAVTDLRLAVNRVFLDKNNNKQEETTFVDIVVWGKQAETVCKYLKKGSPIIVEGALQFESWEQDGQKRSKIKVKAARVQFLGGSANKSGQPQNTNNSFNSAPAGMDDRIQEETSLEMQEEIPF